MVYSIQTHLTVPLVLGRLQNMAAGMWSHVHHLGSDVCKRVSCTLAYGFLACCHENGCGGDVSCKGTCTGLRVCSLPCLPSCPEQFIASSDRSFRLQPSNAAHTVTQLQPCRGEIGCNKAAGREKAQFQTPIMLRKLTAHLAGLHRRQQAAVATG